MASLAPLARASRASSNVVIIVLAFRFARQRRLAGHFLPARRAAFSSASNLSGIFIFARLTRGPLTAAPAIKRGYPLFHRPCHLVLSAPAPATADRRTCVVALGPLSFLSPLPSPSPSASASTSTLFSRFPHTYARGILPLERRIRIRYFVFLRFTLISKGTCANYYISKATAINSSRYPIIRIRSSLWPRWNGLVAQTTPYNFW